MSHRRTWSAERLASPYHTENARLMRRVVLERQIADSRDVLAIVAARGGDSTLNAQWIERLERQLAAVEGNA